MKEHQIASEFCIEGKVLSVSPIGDGFINDTFLVETTSELNYVLQRKNSSIFRDVPAMMENALQVTLCLSEKYASLPKDKQRKTMDLVLTQEGKAFHKDRFGDFWTMTVFIDNTCSFDVVPSDSVAYEAGSCIGQFQSLLSDYSSPLSLVLPGFHDMRFRFEQWDAARKKNFAGRVDELKEEISWVESRRSEMMYFWQLVEAGFIPNRVAHNDTKISNILFDQEQKALCLIDLDTVMNSTVLNDFGDAVRSYTNTGLEDDAHLDRVGMDLSIFKAFAKGYIEEAAPFLNEHEIQWLAFSARFITFEQVLRFLMDYIDGDVYYKIKYPEHNLVRTKAQYKLLQSIETNYVEMKRFVIEQFEQHPVLIERRNKQIKRNYKVLE